jgi:hypothetical protein
MSKRLFAPGTCADLRAAAQYQRDGAGSLSRKTVVWLNDRSGHDFCLYSSDLGGMVSPPDRFLDLAGLEQIGVYLGERLLPWADEAWRYLCLVAPSLVDEAADGPDAPVLRSEVGVTIRVAPSGSARVAGSHLRALTWRLPRLREAVEPGPVLPVRFELFRLHLADEGALASFSIKEGLPFAAELVRLAGHTAGLIR